MNKSDGVFNGIALQKGISTTNDNDDDSKCTREPRDENIEKKIRGNSLQRG